MHNYYHDVMHAGVANYRCFRMSFCVSICSNCFQTNYYTHNYCDQINWRQLPSIMWPCMASGTLCRLSMSHLFNVPINVYYMYKLHYSPPCRAVIGNYDIVVIFISYRPQNMHGPYRWTFDFGYLVKAYYNILHTHICALKSVRLTSCNQLCCIY